VSQRGYKANTSGGLIVSGAVDNRDQLEKILDAEALADAENAVLARQLVKGIEDAAYITAHSEAAFKAGNWAAAEILFERRCVLAASTAPDGDAQADLLMRLANIYQKQGKTDDAREARRAVASTWEKSGRVGKNELADRFVDLSQICMAANDTPEAERFAKRALALREKIDNCGTEAVIECLQLLHDVALRQKRMSDANSLQRKIEKLRSPEAPLDEIERALKSYVNLPEWVDLTLRTEGITLYTDDFPRLINESTGLDLRLYFADAFKDADFLKQPEKEKLAQDLFYLFKTVESFVSGPEGGRLERSELTVIDLPPGLSQDFVQKMNVEKEVTFRLTATLPDEVTFENVSGITFDVGNKKIALNQFNLKAHGNMCTVTPILAEQGQVQQEAKGIFGALKNAGKDLIIGAAMKMGKLPPIELPIVLEEFRTYLRDAMNFKALIQERGKDLVMFIERSAGITVDDPLTRSLLTRGMRILKKGADIELVREQKSVCDLGGIALEIAPTIKLSLAKKIEEVEIEKLHGIGVEVPFDAPPELAAIGLDLSRALPKKIISLSLGAKDDEDRRRLVVKTAPGCWMALDLNVEMQPALDARGNWIVVGVTNNPISGAPQNFFLRLDSANNLTMTPREIAQIVTQTAIEGFDPSDPFTWKWGAVALGGQALLTAGTIIRGAAGDTDEVKKTARKLGRFIGKLLNDL
jgi:tetratricopeptide (TPR) repeat protein